LAKDIAMSKSNVERMVQAAERRGHLRIKRGHARASNVYAPILKRASRLDGTGYPTSPQLESRLSGTGCPAQPQLASHLDGTEPLKEPLIEPLRGRKGEFEREAAAVVQQANSERSSRREPPLSMSEDQGEVKP
jgi:uncharacterized protein YkwD